MEQNTQITMEAFESYCARAVELKEKVDSFEKEIKIIGEELTPLKGKILAYLEHFEKDKHYAAGHTFYIQERFSVSMPQDLDKKKELFNYLRARKIYDEMVTVNSATLNSWHKKEMDLAIEQGNVDFKIPGLDEPKLSKSLILRRA